MSRANQVAYLILQVAYLVGKSVNIFWLACLGPRVFLKLEYTYKSVEKSLQKRNMQHAASEIDLQIKVERKH